MQFSSSVEPNEHPGGLYLRLSITDRCNYHCSYCRPGAGNLGDREPGLDAAALLRLVGLINEVHPVGKVRLTGGEPLLHPDVAEFTRHMAALLPGVELGLTTNGSMLAHHAGALQAAGLGSVNISLDTAEPVLFREMTGGGDLSAVLAGLAAARRAGIARLKLNAVLQQRSAGGDGLFRLVEVAREHRCEIRFIELMPMGAAARDFDSQRLRAEDALCRIARHYHYCGSLGMNGTAFRHRFRDGDQSFVVGFISPLSDPFCGECNRLRLDCRGRLYPCLRDPQGMSLLPWLEGGPAPGFLLPDGFQKQAGRSWPRRSMISTGG